MRVQRVVMPVTGAESWTLVDDDWIPVEPVERFLAHLAGIERSPNTVKAYAHGLRLWFEFLDLRGVAWGSADVEAVSRFVAWLRAPADNVIVLDDATAVRSAATVNRHLAALFGFYDFHARSGVHLAAELVAWRRVSRGSYKPFLHHVTRGRPIATRPVKLRVPRRLPATLSVEEVTVILAACERLRDRFLFALLAETGMWIGQALGLRHEDFVSRQRQVVIVPRGRQRQRRPSQVHLTGESAGLGAAGPPLQQLHAHRVWRTGLRLRVREPVVDTGGSALALPGGRQARRPAPNPHRHRLHAAHAARVEVAVVRVELDTHSRSALAAIWVAG